VSLAAALLAVSGCGSSGKGSASQSSSTSTSRAAAPPIAATPPRIEAPPAGARASIVVASEAQAKGGGIAAKYTCKGADISPRIFWAGVSAQAQEVIVFARSLYQGKLDTDWMIAGLPAERDEIREGKVPAGTVLGRDSSGKIGYELCPANGTDPLVILGVVAVPRKLHLQTGFEPRAIAGLIGNPEDGWGATNVQYSAGLIRKG
jgi:phosphatidylethanolamine-binding protein (PEBP) family uncharacterized protein